MIFGVDLDQTLGRMATGIKVVAEATGQAPGTMAAAIRMLLRLVKGLLVYAVAFITVLAVAGGMRVRGAGLLEVVRSGGLGWGGGG